MKRIKLGQTLRQIALEGIETFYNGTIADKIINEIQKKGGILTKKDLKEYKLDFKEALSINLNNSFKLYTSSSPSSGSIILFIINLMFGFNFKLNDFNSIDNLSLFYHRLIESFKFAFIKRSQLGDPFKYNITQVKFY